MAGIELKNKTDENLGIFVNLEWSETLVKELIKQGVRNFCLAYGNRSTPLVLACAHHPLAKTHTHFDERGLGFFALGLAKAIEEPVAIIVTSGTAVGNLMPAVMEAYHAQVPLIVLTADRPHELRETKANQTCDQVKFFGNYARFFFDMPTPDSQYGNRFLQSTIAHAVHKSQYPIKGPVHLNCPFREPFFDNLQTQFNIPFSTAFITPKMQLDLQDLSFLFEQIDLYDEGIILVGQLHETLEIAPLVALSKHFNFPILTEVHSNLRKTGFDAILPYPILTLRHAKKLQCPTPKMVLLIGDSFVSKDILEILKEKEVECVIQVTSSSCKADPEHFANFHLIADISDFCKKAIEGCEKKAISHFFQKWSMGAKKIKDAVDEALDKTDQISEPMISLLLTDLAEQETNFFISNSMPIRFMNDFFQHKAQRMQIYTNRGLSGIDGNIATCVGIASGSESPLIAMIGDQAALHDLNSFSLIKPEQKLLVIIINNSGGSIFYKVASQISREISEKFFVGKHNWQFASIAEMFQIPYLQVDSLDSFSFGLNQFFDKKESMICEVQIKVEENENFLQLVETQINQLSQTPQGIRSYFFS